MILAGAKSRTFNLLHVLISKSLYLYNKNVLEYAQIARSGPKSMIRNIEGSSSTISYIANPCPPLPKVISLNKYAFYCVFGAFFSDFGYNFRPKIMLSCQK